MTTSVYQGWVNAPADVDLANDVSQIATNLFSAVGLPTFGTLEEVNATPPPSNSATVRYIKITVEEIVQ